MKQNFLWMRIARTGALAVLVASVATAAGCGGGAGDQPSDADASAGAPPATETPAADVPTIRLALPSEPLWHWMEDSGHLADWEAAHGLRIDASQPFRPFTALISGDADIILVDALDVPTFAQGLDSDPVIVGKYASDRSIAATKRTSQAADLAGVVEGQIAMQSHLGSTLLWSLVVEQAHELDLSEDSADFAYVIATSGVADTVERGHADACICQPDSSAAALSTGMLRPLYDGRSAAQLYAEQQGTPDLRLLGKVFLAEREWYRSHPREVAAFLELWEAAVGHWHERYPEIIAAYPEFLSLQTQQHVDWLTHHVTRSNWIVPTVYPTEEDARAYAQAVERLKARGQLDANARAPSVITNRPSTPGGS